MGVGWGGRQKRKTLGLLAVADADGRFLFQGNSDREGRGHGFCFRLRKPEILGSMWGGIL